MADPLDVLTLDEGRSAVRAVGTIHDAELEEIITSVSRQLDDMCGPVVIRTVTDEVHRDINGAIIPRLHPVASVTSVSEWSSGVATILTEETPAVAGDYLIASGMVTRRSSWYDSRWASPYVTITYEAGRYADTETVDARFKNAAKILVVSSVVSRGPRRGEVFDAVEGSSIISLPALALSEAKKLLGSEVRPQFSFA